MAASDVVWIASYTAVVHEEVCSYSLNAAVLVLRRSHSTMYYALSKLFLSVTERLHVDGAIALCWVVRRVASIAASPAIFTE